VLPRIGGDKYFHTDKEHVGNNFPNAVRAAIFVIPAQAGIQFSWTAGFPPARE